MDNQFIFQHCYGYGYGYGYGYEANNSAIKFPDDD